MEAIHPAMGTLHESAPGSPLSLLLALLIVSFAHDHGLKSGKLNDTFDLVVVIVQVQTQLAGFIVNGSGTLHMY